MMGKLEAMKNRGVARILQATSLVFVGALILSWGAIWNGYPFTFSDTASYLNTGIELLKTGWPSISWARPPFYGLIILPLYIKHTLWLVAIMQNILISHLLFLTNRIIFGSTDAKKFLTTMLILAFLSSLPWFTSLIIPDILTSVIVISFFILGFGKIKTSRLEYFYVFCIATAAITTHFSHIPLALALTAAIVILKLSLYGRRSFLTLETTAITSTILLAITALLTVQLMFRGELVISPYKDIFLLGRFIADGPALKYLEQECPHRSFKLCGYLDDMKKPLPPVTSRWTYEDRKLDYILWDSAGPFQQITVKSLRDEAGIIVRESIARYPLWHSQLAVSAWIRQMFTFKTGTWLGSSLPFKALNDVIESFFPMESADYFSSRQNREAIHLDSLSKAHAIVLLICMAISTKILIKSVRTRNEPRLGLALLIGGGLLINALICGALSMVDDRYQSRLVWLLVFYATLTYEPHLRFDKYFRLTLR